MLTDVPRRDRWPAGSHAPALIRALRDLGIPEPSHWGRKKLGQPGELRFAAPEREWRFDVAWRDGAMLAIEIEGVSTGKSRHQTIAGYREDCQKYNSAIARGFVTLRYTQDQIERDVATVAAEVASVYRRRLGEDVPLPPLPPPTPKRKKKE